MSLHLLSKIEFALSSTGNQERDRANLAKEITMATANEGGNWHRIVLASITDLELEMPGISDAKFLAILTKLHVPTPAPDPSESPVALQFKLNGVGNTPFLVAPDDDGLGVFVISTSALASLHVTNPDAAVGMEVTWLAVGD